MTGVLIASRQRVLAVLASLLLDQLGSLGFDGQPGLNLTSTSRSNELGALDKYLSRGKPTGGVALICVEVSVSKICVEDLCRVLLVLRADFVC